uniref:Uncharacterized protein n=1 Tax=Picea glauca TaxID=3330 RepID=A0A101M2Q0_PICGL|nr:hypothetical protein ABT39_MTgene3101 [Picea glauca]QHR87202.1 hypothetical protein Q903MT_gene1211 [Picea sitchensis]
MRPIPRMLMKQLVKMQPLDRVIKSMGSSFTTTHHQ